MPDILILYIWFKYKLVDAAKYNLQHLLHHRVRLGCASVGAFTVPVEGSSTVKSVAIAIDYLSKKMN